MGQSALEVSMEPSRQEQQSRAWAVEIDQDPFPGPATGSLGALLPDN